MATAARTVSEGDGTVAIGLVLDKAATAAVTVPLTVSGTATSAIDYTALPTSITIPVGQSAGSVSLVLTNDASYEPSETVVIAIGTPVNATRGAVNATTVTIMDNDVPPVVQFTTTGVTAAESAGSAVATLSVSPVSGKPVVVTLSTSGTAIAADRGAVPTTITIPAGTASFNVPVTIIDDALNEATETVILTLTAATDATIGARPAWTLSITDNDPVPTVAINTATAPVTFSEGGGTLSVPLVLSAVSGRDVTVGVAVTGTTTAGLDYTAPAATVTIPAGATGAPVLIPLLNDVLDEPDETLIFTIKTPVNATLGAAVSQTVTITDNDAPPTIAWSVAAQTVAESVGNVTVTATLSAVSAFPVTATITTGGTAVSGTDYKVPPVTVTIPAGATSAAVSVTVTNDVSFESAETLTLTLSAPVNATLGATKVQTITITDDDVPPVVQFSAATATVTEAAGTANATLTVTPVSGKPVTVTLAASGTAGAADRGAVPTTVTIPAGTASLTVPITIVDDALNEPTETVVLSLTAATNATVGTNASWTLSITDNDPLPTVTIDTATATVTAAENGGKITVPVVLSAVSGRDVSVSVALSGTATAGIDYTAPAATLTIPAGASKASLVIPVINDTLDEADETVIVTIKSPVNATLGTAVSSTATIVDDDAPPRIAWSQASQTVAEPVGTVTLTAKLSAASSFPVTALIQATGTATVNTDYKNLPTKVTIPAGATSAAVTFEVIDDLATEPSETVAVTLATPTNATLGTIATHTVTITDDDPLPTVTVTAPDPVAGEPADPGLFRVARTGRTGLALTITLAATGTATKAVDYQALPTTLTFPINVDTIDIPVTILDDTLVEPSETIILTIVPAAAYAVVGGPATVVIADDELPQVTLTVPDVQASEPGLSAGGGMFQLNRSGSLLGALPVTLVASGTATAGADYSALPTQVVIPAGAASVQVPVTVLDDALAEPSETVVATVVAGTGYTLGTPLTQTVTILDDELPVVSLVATDSSAAEAGSDPGKITISRTGNLAAALTVPIVWSGTATPGVDTAALPASIVIPAAATAASLIITPVDDAQAEGNETLIATLGAAATFTPAVGATSATVTILDNESSLFLTVVKPLAVAGGATASVQVRRTGPTTAAVAVGLQTGGTAMSGVDYQALPATVTIPAGSSTATLAVTALQPGSSTANRDHQLTLATIAASGYVNAPPQPVTLRIRSGPAPTLQLSPSSATPLAITAKTLQMTAVIQDGFASTDRQIAWSVTPSATATIAPIAGSPLGALATFTRAGTYTVTATVQEPTYGFSMQAAQIIRVDPVYTTLTVTGATTIAPGDTTQATARALDQFGQDLAMSGTAQWSTTLGTVAWDGSWWSGLTTGTGSLSVTWGGKSQTLPVTVAGVPSAAMNLQIAGNAGGASVWIPTGSMSSVSVTGPAVTFSRRTGTTPVPFRLDGVAGVANPSVTMTVANGGHLVEVLDAAGVSQGMIPFQVDGDGPVIVPTGSVPAILQMAESLPALPADLAGVMLLNHMADANNQALSAQLGKTFLNAASFTLPVRFTDPVGIDPASLTAQAVDEAGATQALRLSAPVADAGAVTATVSGFAQIQDSLVYTPGTLALSANHGHYRIRLSGRDRLGNLRRLECGYFWLKQRVSQVQLAKMARTDGTGSAVTDGVPTLNPGGVYRFGMVTTLATTPDVVKLGRSFQLEAVTDRGRPIFWSRSWVIPTVARPSQDTTDPLVVFDVAGNYDTLGWIESHDFPSADPPPAGQVALVATQQVEPLAWSPVAGSLSCPYPTSTTAFDYDANSRFQLCGKFPLNLPAEEVCPAGGMIDYALGYATISVPVVREPIWGLMAIQPMTFNAPYPWMDTAGLPSVLGFIQDETAYTANAFGPQQVLAGIVSPGMPAYVAGPLVPTDRQLLNPSVYAERSPGDNAEGFGYGHQVNRAAIPRPSRWAGGTVDVSFGQPLTAVLPLDLRPLQGTSSGPTFWNFAKPGPVANYVQASRTSVGGIYGVRVPALAVQTHVDGWFRFYPQDGTAFRQLPAATVLAPDQQDRSGEEIPTLLAGTTLGRDELTTGLHRLSYGRLGHPIDRSADRALRTPIVWTQPSQKWPAPATIGDGNTTVINRAGFRSTNVVGVDTDVIGTGAQTVRVTGFFFQQELFAPPVQPLATSAAGTTVSFFRIVGTDRVPADNQITVVRKWFSGPLGNADVRQTLTLEVQVAASATGLYDLEIVNASEVLGQQVSVFDPQANWFDYPIAPFRLAKALAVVSLTPRLVSATGAIQPLADNTIPVSTPNPTIRMSAPRFVPDATQTAASERLSGTLILDGTVGSWTCDVTPGAAGTITQAQVFLNGGATPLTQIALVTTKTTGPAPRKYPYTGTFHAELPITVPMGLNAVRVQVTDPVFGRPGSAAMQLEVRRDAAPDAIPGGLARIEQSVQATIDLTGLDIAQVTAGAAVVPTTYRSLVDGSVAATPDGVQVRNEGPQVLRGTGMTLRVDPAALTQAKAKTIQVFTAVVDAPSAWSEARTVTFRRTTGDRFASDAWNLQVWAPKGLSGSDPITVTLQRGAGGPFRTAVLTKVGTLWSSSDNAIQMTLTTTTDAQGNDGLTAEITCAALDATATRVQAVRLSATQPGGGPSGAFTSANVRVSAGADDREGALGALRAGDAIPAAQDDREAVTALALQVDGPAEIINAPGFTVPTLAGARKIVQKDGAWYVATADGSAPESLYLVTKDQVTGSGSNGIPAEDPTDASAKDGVAWYAAGFAAGIGSGGAALVTGLGEICYEAAKVQIDQSLVPSDLILSLVPGDIGQSAQQRNDQRWASMQAKAEVGASIAQVLAKVSGDNAALAKALLTWDPVEQNRILGEYAMYGEVVGLFMSAALNAKIDEYNAADDYTKGKMSGRIFFETALILAPAIKGLQAAAAARGLTTAVVATEVCKNIRVSKWFTELPADMQAMVTKVLLRVQVTLGAMQDAKWVAYYAKDAGGMVGAEQLFLMALEKRNAGLKPIEALVAVEKELRAAGAPLHEKALNAAMLDAMAEESGSVFYVRSDGARIIKTCFHYLDSGNVPFIASLRNGILLGRQPNRAFRYSSFESFGDAGTARRKMQIPLHEDLTPMNDAKIRVEFDTKQNMDALEVPMEFWGKGDKLEPIANCYTNKKPWGEGGATQVVDRKELIIKKATNIETGEVLYVEP